MQVKHFTNSSSKQPPPQTPLHNQMSLIIPPPASSNSSVNATASTASSSHHSTSHTGAIAGGTVGGICGLALIALLAYLLVRYRNRRAAATPEDPSKAISEKDSDQATPQQPYPVELKGDGRPLEMEGAGLHELSEEHRSEMEGTKINELPGDTRVAELRGQGVDSHV